MRPDRPSALPLLWTMTAALGLVFGAASMLAAQGLARGPACSQAGAPAVPAGTTASETLLETLPETAPEDRTAPPQPGTAPDAPASAADRSPAPGLLTIATLGVSASVVPVGVLPDGAMEIPDAVDTVGWYATDHRHVSPGDPGTAVLAGHRDSRVDGPGALHDLSRLGPGDVIDVTHVDGRISTWRVDEVRVTLRDELPSDVLFAREGAPRLALVTCGGTFDPRTRSYSHNTIVLATLDRS